MSYSSRYMVSRSTSCTLDITDNNLDIGANKFRNAIFCIFYLCEVSTMGCDSPDMVYILLPQVRYIELAAIWISERLER